MKLKTTAQLGEHIIGEAGNSLTLTDDGVVYDGPEQLTLSQADITGVRRTTLAGFATISFTMALASIVLTALGAYLFLESSGLDPVSGGALLSGALSGMGFIMFSRAQHGTIDVLTIETPAGTYRFTGENIADDFDTIAAHLRSAESPCSLSLLPRLIATRPVSRADVGQTTV